MLSLYAQVPGVREILLYCERLLDVLLAWFHAVPFPILITIEYLLNICTQCYVYLVRYPDNDMYIVAITRSYGYLSGGCCVLVVSGQPSQLMD